MGKEKKIKEPVLPYRGFAENLKSIPVQQPIQEQQAYNPYAKEWKEIFEHFFKGHTFKMPEYEKLDTTEIHIFKIPTLTTDDFINKAEQIENFIGKRIYKVYKGYEGIGTIGVEFEMVELPKIIDYDEVPQNIKNTEIILGKSIKSWITWDLSTSPHALVVGATGGGKSVTMNFLINEVVKKRWLPYFVDFKGGTEFNIYKDKGYSVFTDRNDFTKFTKKLYGELKYRSRLLAENNAKSIDVLNKKFKAENKRILPKIITFIDEYADVNSVKDEYTDTINSSIGGILAKGRAVGIHIVIGTQRPDAKTIGEGSFRDNITCRLIGKMNSESAYAMSFGTNSLTKEDKVYVNKMLDDDRFKGMFIVQGTGTISDKEIIKVPFMADGEFENIVLNFWEDNPYANYKLHYEENDESDNDEKFSNKIYGKEAVTSVNDYDQIKAEAEFNFKDYV